MSILNDGSSPVQGKGSPSVPSEREAGPQPPAAPGKSDKWTTRVPSTFSDHDTNELSRDVKAAIQAIERFARGRCFTYASSEKLAKKYGTKVRAWELVRNKLVEGGWILVEECEPGKYAGSIILLLKRIDEHLPVFDPEHDSIDDIRDSVRLLKTGQQFLPFAQRIAPTSRSPLRENRPPPAPPLMTEDDEFETTTTNSRVRDHEQDNSQSSSSFHSQQLPQTPTNQGGDAVTGTELHGEKIPQALCTRAVAKFGWEDEDQARSKIAAAMADYRCPADEVRKAMDILDAKKGPVPSPWGFVRGTLANFEREGPLPEAKRKPTPPPETPPPTRRYVSAKDWPDALESDFVPVEGLLNSVIRVVGVQETMRRIREAQKETQ